jgi:hypothetical protein
MSSTGDWLVRPAIDATNGRATTSVQIATGIKHQRKRFFLTRGMGIPPCATKALWKSRSEPRWAFE